MCTDGQPRTSCVHPDCADGHPRTATDVLCVLAETHGRPVWTHMDSHRRPLCAGRHPRTSCVPRGPKSPEQSKGRVSVLSPRTNVLICVLMDSHGRPVCADGHTRTATDVWCVLTDTHGCPVCADGHPRTSYSPRGPKITQTVHRKGQRAESKDQRADMSTDVLCVLTNTHGHTRTATGVLCVLTDTHGRHVCADGHPRTSCPQTSCVCWRTPTDVLCVLNRQPTWAKITQTIHGKGQH
ncbi:unnamed protein product, partial [Brassica rapa]